MKGYCSKCGMTQSVHRAAWTRYRPQCRQCGGALQPDEASKEAVASRKQEYRKGIVDAVQYAALAARKTEKE